MLVRIMLAPLLEIVIKCLPIPSSHCAKTIDDETTSALAVYPGILQIDVPAPTAEVCMTYPHIRIVLGSILNACTCNVPKCASPPTVNFTGVTDVDKLIIMYVDS